MTIASTPATAPQRVPALHDRARRRRGLGAVVVALILVRMTSAHSQWGRLHDTAALSGRHVGSTSLRWLDSVVLGSITTWTLAGALMLIAVVGHRQGGLRLTLRSLTSVVGAIVTSELLKLALPPPGPHGQAVLGGGSFPSGHATIAAAVTLVLLSSCTAPWRRRLALPLLAWTVLVASATITMGWHRPSDVVGGLLIALAWHLFVVPTPWTGPVLRRAFSGWLLATAVVLVAAVPRAESWSNLLNGESARNYPLGLAAAAAGVGCLIVARAHSPLRPSLSPLVVT